MKRIGLIGFFGLMLLWPVRGQNNQQALIVFDTIHELVERGNPRTAQNVAQVLGFNTIFDGGGGTFIATNTVAATNTSTRIYSGVAGWSWELIFGTPIPGGTGEANSGANLGAGVGVFAGKVGVQLQFNSITGAGGVQVSSNGSVITIDGSEITDWVEVEGLVRDGTTDNTATLQGAINGAADGATLFVRGPGIIRSGELNVTNKDVSFVGLSSPMLQAKDHMTGPIIHYRTAQKNAKVEGFSFHGNYAGQNAHASNWHPIIRVFNQGTTSVRYNYFTNTVSAAVSDTYSVSGTVLVENNFIHNAGPHGGTLGLHTQGVSLGLSSTNSTVHWVVRFNTLYQDALHASPGRDPGGIIASGSEGQGSFPSLTAEHNYLRHIGQSWPASGPANHVGAITAYEDLKNVTIARNYFKECPYIRIQFQNSGQAMVNENIVDGGGSDPTISPAAIYVNPIQRAQTNEVYDYFQVQGNILVNLGFERGIFVHAALDAGGTPRTKKAYVLDNVIENQYEAILFQNVTNSMEVARNRIFVTKTGASAAGIAFIDCSDTINVVNNLVRGFGGALGIIGNSGVQNADFLLRDNDVENDTAGAYAVSLLGVRNLRMPSGRYKVPTGGADKHFNIAQDGAANLIDFFQYDMLQNRLEGTASFGVTYADITESAGFLYATAAPGGVIAARMGTLVRENGNVWWKVSGTGAVAAQWVRLNASDDAYDATGWNTDTTPPSKNSIRDKFETLVLGDGVTINTLTVDGVDFDDAIPSPPGGGLNVRWQRDGSAPANVSGYIPMGDLALGWGQLTSVPAGFADGVDDVGSGGGSDTDAIHDNVGGEITAVADKATPVAADHLLIEDSAASNAKKDITIGSLETALEGVLDLENLQGAVTDGQVPDDITLTFPDADNNFGATTLAAALSELDNVNGSGPNAADGKLDWSQIVNVPAGFADGADDAGAGGGDADAIHDNVGGEIAAVADKATPVAADHLLIEDSAASNAKKDITIGSLEAALEGVLDLENLQGAVTDGQVPNTITVDLAAVATTANAGDSATAFFSSGTMEAARLGSGTADGTTVLFGDQSFKATTGSGNVMRTRAGQYTRIFVPAGAMTPVSSAAATYTPSTTTDGMAVDALAFDGAATEYSQWVMKLPGWDVGNVRVRPVWVTKTGTANQGVVLQMEMGGADSLDTFGNILGASASSLVYDIGNPASLEKAIDQSYIQITVANSPAANAIIYCRLARLGASGSDTHSGDILLLGVWVEYLESTTELSTLN